MREIILAVAALGASTGTALAVPVVLTYHGNSFERVYPAPDGLPDPQVPLPWVGTITLETSAYGGTLAGKTISFSGITGTWPDYTPILSGNYGGLVEWSHSLPLASTAGTSVDLTFNAGGILVSWYIEVLDGPPDYVSSTTQDIKIGGGDFNDNYYLAPPGTWTTTYVPLPQSALMLLTALSAVGVARRLGALKGGRGGVLD